MSTVSGMYGRKMERNMEGSHVAVVCNIVGFIAPKYVEAKLPGDICASSTGTVVRVPINQLQYEQVDWLAEDFRAKLLLAAGLSDQRTREPK